MHTSSVLQRNLQWTLQFCCYPFQSPSLSIKIHLGALMMMMGAKDEQYVNGKQDVTMRKKKAVLLKVRKKVVERWFLLSLKSKYSGEYREKVCNAMVYMYNLRQHQGFCFGVRLQNNVKFAKFPAFCRLGLIAGSVHMHVNSIV